MPIYSYKCQNCGNEFDLLIGMTADPVKEICNKCSSKKIKKTFSSFNVGSNSSKYDDSKNSCSTGTCPTCF